MASLLHLDNDCMHQLCSFLDYESFCAVRFSSRLARGRFKFDTMLQDWKGATEKCLLEHPVTSLYTDMMDAFWEDVNKWRRSTFKDEQHVFYVQLDTLHQRSTVCSDFDPNPFQIRRCKNCLKIKSQHYDRRKGGVLASSKKSNLDALGVKVGDIQTMNPRQLFWNLKVTLQFAYYIAPKACSVSRPRGVRYLVGPVLVTPGNEGKVQPTKNVLMEISTHLGDEFSVSLLTEGCSLSELKAASRGVNTSGCWTP